MIRLVGAELLKAHDTVKIGLDLILMIGIVVLGVAAQIGSNDGGLDEAGDLGASVDSARSAALSSYWSSVRSSFTIEFRHGTITQTILITPRRERVLAAKMLTLAVVGLLFAAIASSSRWQSHSHGWTRKTWTCRSATRRARGRSSASSAAARSGRVRRCDRRRGSKPGGGLIAILVWFLIVESSSASSSM